LTRQYRVELEGQEVVSQVAEHDGRKRVWVLASLEPRQVVEYVVRRGKPNTSTGTVTVERRGGTITLANPHLAIKLPAAASNDLHPTDRV